jgi:hypothetical protein
MPRPRNLALRGLIMSDRSLFVIVRLPAVFSTFRCDGVLVEQVGGQHLSGNVEDLLNADFALIKAASAASLLIYIDHRHGQSVCRRFVTYASFHLRSSVSLVARKTRAFSLVGVPALLDLLDLSLHQDEVTPQLTVFAVISLS